MTDKNPIKIWYTDHAGQYRRLMPRSGKYTARRLTNKMVPRQLRLTLPAGAPVEEFTQITATDRDKVFFRGYAKFVETDYMADKKEVTVEGMEGLLNYRVTPKFALDKYHIPTIGEVFSDKLREGAPPGILAIANSWIMPGQSYILTAGGTVKNPIVRLPGMGTDSDIGTAKLFFLSQTDVKQLEQVYDTANMTVGDSKYIFYRDPYNLDVLIGWDNQTVSWRDWGGLFAENHVGKDTSCRGPGSRSISVS